MVKAEQGSEYTGRKRGRRGGFRNPAFREMVRNGEVSPSAELTPATSKRYRVGSDDDGQGEYKRLYYAQMETLITYFDEEWFDFDGMISNETNSGDKGKKNNVFRCEFCLKPWSTGERYSDVEYYSRSTFKNIPMENKTCQECESVLPVDIV